MRSREDGQEEQRPLQWGWLGNCPTWSKAQETEQSQHSPATKYTLPLPNTPSSVNFTFIIR